MTTTARVLILAAAAAVAASIAAVPAANADPNGCDFAHTCSYDPRWSGPLLSTWDTPGTYGGWTTLPEFCNPITYQCQQIAAP